MKSKTLRIAVLLAGLAQAAEAKAAELIVDVTGIRSDRGEIGCALFAGEAGFPLDPSVARMDWQPARRAGTTCRFEGLTPGAYALAISHDLNGNRKADSNFLGMPTEDWGVSNGVRPSMRAPRFREALFEVPTSGTARIAVAVGP